MKKGVDWTNRVMGRADAIHNCLKINLSTLHLDKANGASTYPKYVFKHYENILALLITH
jgi:hypothetical protein